MSRQHINPPELVQPVHYTHVVTASDSTLVFISGQVAYDSEGKVIGDGDFETQARKAFENLVIALNAAGATFADVLKLTMYVVGYTPVHRDVLRKIRGEFFAGITSPASTLLGVEALARPELLVEIDAIAALQG
jgi:enamine deaminase RidA (YjgF/YER057c/UK114 family)